MDGGRDGIAGQRRASPVARVFRSGVCPGAWVPSSPLSSSSSPLSSCLLHPCQRPPRLQSLDMLPSFARVAARPACRLPVAALIARRAMATGPSGAAGDLLQATLGTDARPPSTPTGTASPSSLDAAASTSSSTPADASAGVDANLYGPRDFYGASTSTSSSPSSFSSSFLDPSAAHDGADRFDSATVPYAPSAIPQTSDPLCDFWVGLNMTHGNKLKATIFLSKILDAMYVLLCSRPRVV